MTDLNPPRKKPCIEVEDTPPQDDEVILEEMGVEESDKGNDKGENSEECEMNEIFEVNDVAEVVVDELNSSEQGIGDEENQGQEANVVSKTRSDVWPHINIISLTGGEIKNQCKHCKTLLSHQKTGATSHLMRHLREACKYKHRTFPPETNDVAEDKTTQTQLHRIPLSEGQSSISTFTFSFDRVKELAAHMVLAHEYPFIIVEHKVFNKFLRAYTPHYRKISRYIVRKECFAVFRREQDKIKMLFSKVNRVSLTTDCWWSGVQKIGYMVVTAHFVDRNWNLQKRVLSFVNVPPPHNGVALAKEVHRVCNIYGISEKICSVTVDNASANDVCIGILKRDYDLTSNLVLDGKLFHVRCCAHIINLLVRDGLKEIEQIVDVVREGVKYLFGSENRLAAFNEHRLNLKLPSNKLVLDNNTRWNSTFVMLNTAYKYRQCFAKYGEDDDSFERFCLTNEEWAEVNEVCEFLEVFLDVTNLISGSNYPTVNIFLMELSMIKELINAQLDDNKKKTHERYGNKNGS